MSSYKRNYSNYNNSFKKPKTVGFEDPESEEDISEEDFTDTESDDKYGELIISKLVELTAKLDNCINLVIELKQKWQ